MEDLGYRWRDESKAATAQLIELRKMRDKRHEKEAELLTQKKCAISRWWIMKKSTWRDAIDQEKEEELQYLINPLSAFRKP
mgnify:CR=1 FL=1